MKVELCIVFAIPHIMENIVKMVFMQIAKDKKTYKFFIISAHQDLASSKIYLGWVAISVNKFVWYFESNRSAWKCSKYTTIYLIYYNPQ